LDREDGLGAPNLLEVGRIDRAHGLKGEVVVTLVTDRVERLDPGSVLHLADGTLEVLASKPFKHRWLVEFAGVTSREAADALHGAVLSAEPVDDPDVLWVHELIGSELRTPDGRVWGRVTVVHDAPASDLLELDDGTLVPVVFVVDHRPGQVVVDPPEGLLGGDDSV
jgi:16S rRNA processing protein RimM